MIQEEKVSGIIFFHFLEKRRPVESSLRTVSFHFTSRGSRKWKANSKDRHRRFFLETEAVVVVEEEKNFCPTMILVFG